MQRSTHNSDGFWLKEFRHTKDNPFVSKYYLDDTAFVVLSVTVQKQGGKIVTHLPSSLPLNSSGMYELFFGQKMSAQQNLDLFKKFYMDFDLSINPAREYDSYNGNTNVFFLKGDSSKDFLERFDYSSSLATNDLTPPLEDFWKLSLGYNRVRNYKYRGDTIEDYEGISSIILAEMGENCLNWIEIKDGYYAEELTKEQRASSSLVLDFKLELDINKMLDWVENNFEDIFTSITNNMGSNSLDFNFIFYPPSFTGMQFVDVPEVIYPTGILKNKVVSEVRFEVRKSLVNNSQKIFEIIFKSLGENPTIIFKDDSLNSPESFLIESSKESLYLKRIPIENSVFEDIGKFDYPIDSFIVTYKIPPELVKFLADTLDYTIIINTSDLTSERNE